MYVNRKDWVVYNTKDIGPLMYVDRYNGGAVSFKFNKKYHTMEITKRGVESPYAYVKHDGSKKHKREGSFYKFHTTNGDYYCSIQDAVNYLPEDLPEICVDNNANEQELDIELDLLIQQIASSILVKGNKVTISADDDISTNFENVTEISIWANHVNTSSTKVNLLTFYRHETHYVIKTNTEVSEMADRDGGIYKIQYVPDYLGVIREFLNDLDRFHFVKNDVLEELIDFLLQGK